MKNKTTTMEVVSVTDPAIDLTKTDLQLYADKRDVSTVVVKKGQLCTRYHLRPLSTKMFNRFVKPAAPAVQNERAFALAVTQVDNMITRDGQTIGNWVPGGTFNLPGIADGTMVSDDEIELFWPSVVEEIGSVAYRMSFLPRTSDETWQLPPSLLEGLKGIFRNAAVIRKASQTSSKEQPKDSQSSSSSSSEKDTAATATA